MQGRQRRFPDGGRSRVTIRPRLVVGRPGAVCEPGPVESGARRVGEPLVVVGGGISGLGTAWRLATSMPHRRVVVLEQRSRTGGVLRGEAVPTGPGVPTGLVVDTGAESLLARRPEALDLIVELGLGGDLVHPRTSRAGVWSRGCLHPMPAGTLMGVPSDPAGLAGLLTAEEVRRASAEPAAAPVDGDDVTVGAWVTERLGQAVVDRLVEPLLGGVYAGTADRLSLRSCVPALWPAARDGSSLLDAATASVSAAAGGGTAAGAEGRAPVFAGLAGGVARLAEVLRDRLVAAGVEVRTGECVQGLRRTGAGWDVLVGRADAARPVAREVLTAAAVVVAVPAPAAGRLLGGVAPAAGHLLRGVRTASTAIVTVVVERAALAHVDLSGVLVPPVEGLLVKAVTLSSSKWDWVAEAAPEIAVVRMSVGRVGEERVLHRSDQDLAAAALVDLRTVLGADLVTRSSMVTRWGGALPQYEVGHGAMVDAVLAEVSAVPGLAVAGSAYGGVGVPACLESANAAADVIRGFVE